MSVGAPINRLDGAEKVTGQARYTADTPMKGVLHAVIVGSTRPHARIVRIDTQAAQAAPGVIRIFTHLNTPKLGKVSGLPLGQDLLPLQSDEVLYEGQPVALVVARSLETALEAARHVTVTYREQPFETNFSTRLEHGEARPFFFWEPDSAVGDVAAAWETSDVRLQYTYRTADRHHCTIEPSATLAVWRGGKLTLFDSVQGVVDARKMIASALQIDPSRVRVRNAYVGGAFGCKGWIWPHQLLAAVAARELGMPVKLVLTRAQTFTSHGYQPATIQTLSISAEESGRLTGIRHDSFVAGSHVGNHVEGVGIGTRSLYACSSISTTHRLVRVHRGDPTPMRAPLEGVGLVAVEIGMDELAYELRMDPLELRLKNYAEHDPTDGKPFSSKKLRECYERGAEQFGWSRRSREPRSMRDGRELIGYGMATAIFSAFRQPSRARISIDRQGLVLVEASTQEIGTGTRTVLPQIAAQALGVPTERVRLAWGDTDLPPAPMTAGIRNDGKRRFGHPRWCAEVATTASRSWRSDRGRLRAHRAQAQRGEAHRRRRVQSARRERQGALQFRRDLRRGARRRADSDSASGPHPRRVRCGTDHQSQDRAQPDDRRAHLGHRTSPARAFRHGPSTRSLSRQEPRGLSRSRERRRRPHRRLVHRGTG